MRRTPHIVAGLAAVSALAGVLAVPACGRGSDPVARSRADQVRVAADHAGLSEDVTDVLALAAEGATATFQVTYAGTNGAQLVVSQEPPNRRVDVVTAGLIVESQVVRDGVAYRCARPDGSSPDGSSPGDPLDCTRTQGAVQAPGAFTEKALDAFTDQLLASIPDLEITVETRTVADVDARCLVTAPKAGTTLDGTDAGVDTICLSAEGAQLLVDVGGQRVVADGYTTEVPEGTFEV